MQLKVENTEEAGREAARMAWNDGTGAPALRNVAALLATGKNIPNPKAVAGFCFGRDRPAWTVAGHGHTDTQDAQRR